MLYIFACMDFEIQLLFFFSALGAFNGLFLQIYNFVDYSNPILAPFEEIPMISEHGFIINLKKTNT